MLDLRSLALSVVFTSAFTMAASGQAFVNQVPGSGGNAAFVPQISGASSAFVPQLGASGGARIDQVPLNARVVPPKPKVRKASQLQSQSVRARRQLSVIGQPSQQSPFPSVGNGTQAIVPPKPDSLPSVRQGAVRL